MNALRQDTSGFIPVPSPDELLTRGVPERNLAQHFSHLGGISYYCRHVLHRSAELGDLSFLLNPLTHAEKEASNSSHTTLFDAYMEWANAKRLAAAAEAEQVNAAHEADNTAPALGRRDEDEVTVRKEEYSASSGYNRALTWQHAAECHVEVLASIEGRLDDKELAGEDIPPALRRRLELLLKQGHKRLAGVKGVVATRRALMKGDEREVSSEAHKRAKHRLVDSEKLYEALETCGASIDLSSPSPATVDRLGQYLVVAMTV